MKAYVISIIINTCLLISLTTLTSIGKYIPLAFLIFSISPIALIVMVYLILKDNGYKGRELKENEEWGYQDKEFRKKIKA
jgi:hypothetical protein